MECIGCAKTPQLNLTGVVQWLNVYIYIYIYCDIPAAHDGAQGLSLQCPATAPTEGVAVQGHCMQVPLHGSRGGVFVGHRPPWDPGGPLQIIEVLHLFRWYTHTLDKNGSLYDPAGTESCNVQIQKIRTAMLIAEIKYQIATTVKWKYSCAVLGLAACHVSQNCNEKMQVRPAGQAGYPISLVASLDTVPVKCCVPLHYLKREKREEKRRKFYIYPDVTHTHPAEPGKPWKARGRKKSGHTTSKRPKTAQGGRGTDGPPEPTYTAKRTWPKQRTHLNPTTHYGEARGEN